MDIQLEQWTEVMVLRVAGDMRLWGRPEERNRLPETFQSRLAPGRTLLVLSLRGLKLVDTMGITALVDLLIKCEAQAITVRTVLPGGVPGQALRAIRIFDRYREFPDEHAAIRAAEAERKVSASTG
ncbi:MAG: STAS domain-containing protein [Gammaproteobacteria bacterium]